jgi:hypothetical protein
VRRRTPSQTDCDDESEAQVLAKGDFEQSQNPGRRGLGEEGNGNECIVYTGDDECEARLPDGLAKLHVNGLTQVIQTSGLNLVVDKIP